MYYERKNNNIFGIIVIVIFLLIIILILLNLMNKFEASYAGILEQEETEETGTDTVLSEFNIENLMKNSIYSVVRNFKIKQHKHFNFC